MRTGYATPGGIIYESDVAEEILRQANDILASGQSIPGRLSPDGDTNELFPHLATHIISRCWADRDKSGAVAQIWIGYESVHGKLGEIFRKVHSKGSYYFSPRGIAKFKDGSTFVDPDGYQLITFDCHIAGLQDI